MEAPIEPIELTTLPSYMFFKAYNWVTKPEMSPLFRLLILAPMLPKSNSPEDYENSESS